MRIRSIKPDFWTSETLAALEDRTRLTFIGVWSYVDDNGVGIDNDRLITAALYPLAANPLQALEATSADLRALVDAGVIVRFEVAGKRYLFVNAWDEHQKISHPRKPRYPRPQPADVEPVASADTTTPGDSGNPPEVLRTVSGVSREQGTGSREEKKTSSSSSRPAAPPGDGADEPQQHPTPPQGSPRADVEALCSRLHQRITEGGSKAAITTAWRKAARLLLDRDRRDLDEALRLVDWCQADAFWSANVLSLPTFRKQYDRLRLRAQADPGWRPVESLTDEEINPDAILGPDVTSPPAPPREVEDGPPAARREWFAAWQQRHRRDRISQARQVLAQRAARAAQVSA